MNKWFCLLPGLVSFVEADGKPDADGDKGELVPASAKSPTFSDWRSFACSFSSARSAALAAGDGPFRYKVDFSLELVCQPAAPLGVLHVQCPSQVRF